GTAEGTAPLDVGELELRQSPAEETTLWTTRRRRRRSILRSVPGVVGVVILLALIVGAAVGKPRGVSALSDSPAPDRIDSPAPGRVPPPADVVPGSATIESTRGTTNNRPPTITARKSAAAPPTSTRPSASSARSAGTLSRTAPPAPRAIE